MDQLQIPLREFTLPLTSSKLHKVLDELSFSRNKLVAKAAHVLDKKGVLRNACTFCESDDSFCTVSVDERKGFQFRLTVNELHYHPFAIFECKRVGVEEGMKKGPQSIEKAKQGAYVARSVSSLQKVRHLNGQVGGIIQLADGSFYHGPYVKLLEEIIRSNDAALLRNFILTVGVVSNHGNWFTAEDHNKELKVLAQSYDWLLFLTDQGLAQFVTELLLEPTSELEAPRTAFLESYNGKNSGKNRFTKVKIDVEADLVLRGYFAEHLSKIEGWFNIIAPRKKSIAGLRQELSTLNAKNWNRILAR